MGTDCIVTVLSFIIIIMLCRKGYLLLLSEGAI